VLTPIWIQIDVNQPKLFTASKSKGSQIAVLLKGFNKATKAKEIKDGQSELSA
jgi:hypothetical protein